MKGQNTQLTSQGQVQIQHQQPQGQFPSQLLRMIGLHLQSYLTRLLLWLRICLLPQLLWLRVSLLSC
jgi:hypothetical protein